MPFREQFTTLIIIPLIVAALAELALSFFPSLRQLSFWRRALIFLSLFLTAAAVVYMVTLKPRDGDTTIAGRVRDQSNGAGIGGVTVGVAGRAETCISDDTGNFNMKLEPKGLDTQVTLTASKTGYALATLNVVPPQHDLQFMLEKVPR